MAIKVNGKKERPFNDLSHLRRPPSLTFLYLSVADQAAEKLR